MSDYSQGKIYTIRSYKCNDVYIGSTTQSLCKRLSQHKSHLKSFLKGKGSYISSFGVICYEDAYIELLESYPCNTKEELNARETYYIRTMECCNKVHGSNDNIAKNNETRILMILNLQEWEITRFLLNRQVRMSG
jgi:hypothetical protein